MQRKENKENNSRKGDEHPQKWRFVKKIKVFRTFKQSVWITKAGLSVGQQQLVGTNMALHISVKFI